MKFLLGILSFATKVPMIKSAFSFVTAHLQMGLFIAVLILGIAAGWKANGALGQMELNRLKGKLADQEAATLRLQKESIDLSNQNVILQERLISGLRETVDAYEKKLEEAKKSQKIKYVKVQVPGETRYVDVMIEKGDVVCRKLPSDFKSSIDESKLKAEESLK